MELLNLSQKERYEHKLNQMNKDKSVLFSLEKIKCVFLFCSSICE